MKIGKENNNNITDENVSKIIRKDENVAGSIDVNTSSPVPFWSDDPNVLFHKNYLFEFFPTNTMQYNQKLNAISRTIILITIFSFSYTRNLRILIASIITLFVIFYLHRYQTRLLKKRGEGFDDPILNDLFSGPQHIPPIDVFDSPTPDNPFSNVLVSDYSHNPNKKPAPPIYTKDAYEKTLENTKKMIQETNPNHPDITKKLFRSIYDNFQFEESLRPFSSTANSVIPNDQGAFMDFCYGSMVSAKEGNMFALTRNLSRHTNN